MCHNVRDVGVDVDTEHALYDVGLGSCVVVDGHVTEVIAQSECGRKPVGEFDIAFVEESQILLWCGEESEDKICDLWYG